MAKILYIWKSPFPWDVRVEKICSSLSKSHNVLLLAKYGGEKDQFEKHKGFEIKRAGYGKPQALLKPIEWNLIWKKEIFQTIEDFKPDIVIHREMFLADIVLKAKQKYGFKLIADIAEHYPFLIDYWEHYNPILKFLASKFKYYYKLEERLVRGSDHIWTVVEENSERLSVYNLNITEIYNSTDTTEVIKIESDRIRFGYHGFINKERNLKFFLKGFDKATKILPDITLDIYGRGPLLDDIKSLANDLSNKRINVHGEYSFDELPEILRKCDVGILPYNRNLQYDNTLSNKFLDYALASIRILSSDNPPMKRLIDNYHLGFTYEDNDLDSLLHSIDKCRISIIDGNSQNNERFITAGYTWHDQEIKMNDTINRLLD